MQERKVRQVMMDAGLYKDGTKEALRTDFIAEEEIQLAGKSYTLSKIAYLDAKIFTDELDTILVQQNPLIHEIFAKNAVSMFDLVRMVNVNSKQGFKGALASGNELDFTLFMARQFRDPDNAAGPPPLKRTSWIRNIAALAPPPIVGLENFIEEDTAVAHAAELLMSEEEGLILLAFYNPAAISCIDGFQIQMNTELFDIQSLDFDQVHTQIGDVIIEMKEPWTLPPEQSGRVQVHYFQNGTDETRPLGIWVKQARNLRALLTP